MRRLIGSLLILVLVLMVPIVPFVCFAKPIEAGIARWCDQSPNPAVTAGLIVGLLSTDIVLPVPSSLVSTFGGSQLGALGGTFASWLGMSLGAGIGFLVARLWGRPVASRLSKPEDLERLDNLAKRYGTPLLVITRALPVLAEAAVLLAGIHRVSWRKFWPPILLANLGIALAYSAFGELAERNHLLPAALGVSLALPLLLAVAVRWWLPKGGSADEQESPAAPPDEQPGAPHD